MEAKAIELQETANEEFKKDREAHEAAKSEFRNLIVVHKFELDKVLSSKTS